MANLNTDARVSPVLGSSTPSTRPNTKISNISQKPMFPGVAQQVRAFEGEYTYNYSAHSARMIMDMKPLFATVMGIVPPLASLAFYPIGTALTHIPTLVAYLAAVAGISRVLVRGNMNTVEKDLVGRIVVVTGGTGGMGREVVAEMLRMGATVIVVAKPNPEAEAETVELAKQRTNGKVSILPTITLSSPLPQEREGGGSSLLGSTSDGPQLVFMPLDLGYFSMIRTWTRRYKTITDNRLDLLIHCCGVIHYKPVTNRFGDDDQLSSNLLGPYLFTEAMLPLVDNSNGRIVFTTTSAMSLIGKKVVHKYLIFKQGKEWNPDHEDPEFTVDRDKAPGVSVHQMESLGSNTVFEMVLAKTKLLTNVSRSYEHQDKRTVTTDPLFNRGVRKQAVKVPSAAEAAAAATNQRGGGRAGGRMFGGTTSTTTSASKGETDNENARADSFIERFIAAYVTMFKRAIPGYIRDRFGGVLQWWGSTKSGSSSSPSPTNTSSNYQRKESSPAPQLLKYDCLEQFGFTKLGCIYYTQDLGVRSYRHSIKMAEALKKAGGSLGIPSTSSTPLSSSISNNAAATDAAFKYARMEELDPAVNRSDAARFTTCVVNPGGVITGHYNELPNVARCFKWGYYACMILMRTPFEGAQTIVNAALRDDLVNGGYYQNGRYTPSALSDVACDVEERKGVMKWVKARTYSLLDQQDTRRGGDSTTTTPTPSLNSTSVKVAKK